MSGFLLDTNVISELIRPAPDARVVRWADDTEESLLFLSVLTLGEIRKGIMTVGKKARRGRLEFWLTSELRSRFHGRILPIDEAIADCWGTIAALAATRGRPVPVIDGLLAATAQHHNLTFVTRNDSDVAGAGIRVLNPWH